MYQEVWEPRISEAFFVLHESGNEHDRHTMAVYRSELPGVIVGHLPHRISKSCNYFARHDGKIRGEVSKRVHSEEAGGLERTHEQFPPY